MIFVSVWWFAVIEVFLLLYVGHSLVLHLYIHPIVCHQILHIIVYINI